MSDRRRMTLKASRIGSILVVAIAVTISLAGASTALAQPSEATTEQLRADLEATFDILPLSDGWLLRPRESSAGYQAIEVRGSELAIDGTPVSADELRARLDSSALPVLRFAEIDADARSLLFSEIEEARSRGAVEAEEEARAEAEEVASAEEEVRAERRERREVREVNRTDAQVVVGSSVVIEEDEVTRDVLAVGGSVKIHGLVKGDAVAVGGSIMVDGEVTGDVAAIGGSVDLEPGALIGSEAISIGGTVNKDPDAVVEGQIQEVPFFPSLRIGGWSGPGVKTWHGPDVSVDISPARTAFSFAWEIFSVALLTLLAALTLLVARRPVERVGEQVVDEPWKSGLVGLLCQILFFPLLVLLILILVVSIVGIPFLLLLPFAILALVLVGLMGYTAVALRVGRWSERRFGWTFASPFLALLVGIGLLEVWSLLGELLGMGPGPIKFFAVMFAIFGAVVCYAAWTVGFGGAVLSRFGTTPTWSGGGGGDESAGWEAPLNRDLDSTPPAVDPEPYTPDPGSAESTEWPSEDSDEPRE